MGAVMTPDQGDHPLGLMYSEFHWILIFLLLTNLRARDRFLHMLHWVLQLLAAAAFLCATAVGEQPQRSTSYLCCVDEVIRMEVPPIAWLVTTPSPIMPLLF